MTMKSLSDKQTEYTRFKLAEAGISPIFTDEVVQYLPDARVLKDGFISCDCRGNWWFHHADAKVRMYLNREVWEVGHYHTWTSDGMLELPGVDFEYIPDLSDLWADTLIYTRDLELLQKAARNRSEKFWAKKKQETAA